MGAAGTGAAKPPSGTVIRAPNHLGDVVMALPALMAAGSDVMVVRSLAPILEMAGLPGTVLPLDRGLAGFTRAVRVLRRRGYRRGVLLSASFSAAWLFRCGGVRKLRGTHTDGRGWLLADRIGPAELRGRHRVEGLRMIAGVEEGAGPARPRIAVPSDRAAKWNARLRGPTGRPRVLVGLFPGSNAPARRWPVERFAELGSRASGPDRRVVVLGGPPERPVTATVASGIAGAIDLGGRTDLVDLAAILSLCDLVVTNDTGPMHLAGAVGTPTISLWGPSDPGEVRQTGSLDIPVTGAELPCRPCYRNDCHRRGRGTLLEDAHEECMRLIDVQDVAAAVEVALGGRNARE